MPVDRTSLTRLALRSLYEIEAAAMVGPVEIGWGDRLALAWLVHVGAAEPWQARNLVQVVTEPLPMNGLIGQADCTRATLVTATVRGIHRKLGLGEPRLGPTVVRARRYALEMLDEDDGQPQPWLMCNRYRPAERDAIAGLFGPIAFRDANPGPTIVHPREPAWVVRSVEGALVAEQMTWGFPVVLRGKSGAPLKPKPVNNARFDKLGSFWKRWAQFPRHRCLIPAVAYAEAVGLSGTMRTTWLSIRSAPIFAWAGLWDNSPEWGRVMIGVMTTNAPELELIHDRSPVIIAPDDWSAWLEAPLPELVRFDRPWPAEDVKVTRTEVLWKAGGSLDAYRTLPWTNYHPTEVAMNGRGSE